MRFEGKVVVVTGASRGIGRRLALGFAREGADVVVAARTAEEGQHFLPGSLGETARQVEALGRRALAVRCDISDEESVAAMVRSAMESFGRINVLVNNAAVNHAQPLHEIPIKKWDLVIKVNVRGTFLCMQAVLQHMIAARSGSIVNISSIAGDHRESPRIGTPYAASKAAIERMTSAVAEEIYPFNIAVNGIKPFAAVDTEGFRFWSPGADYSTWHQAEEYMVPGTLFLATQDAAGVTGRTFIDRDLCRFYRLEPMTPPE